ncbi:MAG: hypothetical protein IJ237_00540 [Oscillospiraceae bacterium]|nr:hypothetical protein [Oscillospiraceae bacterium]
MKRISAFLLFMLLLLLSACGKEEPKQETLVNWTLPDVTSFEESYTSEKETVAAESEKEEEQNTRWKPHGVYTYVYGASGENGSWSTALFKIATVDYEKRCAVVTYTVKDNYGYSLAQQEEKNPNRDDYFFESGGEKVVGLEEKEEADGSRTVILYLSKKHALEFTGSGRIEQAKYRFANHTYRLKYEG